MKAQKSGSNFLGNFHQLLNVDVGCDVPDSSAACLLQNILSDHETMTDTTLIDGVATRPATATDLATFKMTEEKTMEPNMPLLPALLKRRSLIFMGVSSLTLLSQQGCTAMPLNLTGTNPLRFKEHAMEVSRYSASQMTVTYGRHSIYRSVFLGSRPEVIRAKTPADEKRDLTGSYLGLNAFEGPLRVKWRSLDGEAHEATLNLEDIFKDRIVLHREDPSRIDPSLPMSSYGPTIVIEVNDRTLSIAMFVHIYLRPVDPNARTREDRINYTLAYSKTF